MPMPDWFSTLAARSEFPPSAASELQEQGFVVLPGPVPGDQMERFANAYTAAVSAAMTDIRIGSTSTRVSDFVNRGAEFDARRTQTRPPPQVVPGAFGIVPTGELAAWAVRREDGPGALVA